MQETKRERAPKKEIFGWAMYDFANSSYTTVIITVVYAVIFTEIIVPPDTTATGDARFKEGNLWWSVALGISYLLVVLTGPIFGAIMDYSASKKKFLAASTVLTIVSTALLVFVQPGYWYLGIILVLISNFGFATGESFVSSFLPDLGPQEDLGKISGYAWGLGYFGGLLSTILITGLLGSVTTENFAKIQWVGPLTALFFLLAAIPTFLFVKEKGRANVLPPGESYIGIGFKRLSQTMSELKDFRDLMIFLVSVFFSMAGLSIVISFAFIYGKQIIHWDDTVRILMFVVTQFTAAGGAVLFGFIQDKIGAKKTFNMTLVLWIVAVILIWGTNDLTAFINGALGTKWQAQYVFLFVGCLAGLGLGSTQSASRAIVGVFSPESKAGEFFGFWGLSGKLASAFGLFALGLLQNMLGLKNAILVCMVFFILALVFNLLVNEEQGIKSAIEHEGE